MKDFYHKSDSLSFSGLSVLSSPRFITADNPRRIEAMTQARELFQLVESASKANPLAKFHISYLDSNISMTTGEYECRVQCNSPEWGVHISDPSLANAIRRVIAVLPLALTDYKMKLSVPEEPTAPASCGICGGKQVLIRSRHPGGAQRPVCPQCVQERLDNVHEISGSGYGQVC